MDNSALPRSEAFLQGMSAAGGGRSIFGQADETPRLDTETLDTFTTIANKYGVPADVLLGMAEKDSGFNSYNRTRGPGPKARGIIAVSDQEVSKGEFNPYDKAENIEAAARKLRTYMDSGMTVEEAIKAHAAGPNKDNWGPEADAYQQDVLSRSARLSETYYPGMAPRVAETETKVDPSTGRPVPLTAEEEAKLFNIQPATPTVSDNIGDAATLVAKGASGAIQHMNELTHMVPGVGTAIDTIDRAVGGKTLAERGKEIDARLEKNLTPAMAEARKKQWLTDDYKLGDAWGDWRSYVGGIAESLPETAITSIPVMRLAKGVFAANLAAGATAEAAATAAAKAATISGAASEGLLGGAASKQSVEEKVRELPIDTLRKSDAFNALVASGMSEDKARESLAKDQGAMAFVLGTVATGIFSGVGDGVLAKTFLGHMGEDGAKGFLARLGKSFFGEAAEETPQSAGQQMAENLAVQGANPDQRLMEGVANQAAGGFVLGGLTGMGMGALYERGGNPQTAQPTAPPQERREPTLDGSVSVAPEGMAPPVEPQTRDGVPPVQSTEVARDLAAGAPGRQTVADVQAAGNAAPAPQTASNETPAPQGPLSRVLATGAPNAAPLANIAGKRVTLTDEIGTVSGSVISQDADGILFVDDTGYEQVIDNELITSGKVRIVPAGAQSEPVAPQVEAAPPVEAAAPAVQETTPPALSEQAAVTDEPAVAIKPRAYSDMTEPELVERKAFIEQQARASGGWNKRLIEERNKVEEAINALAASQPVEAAPAEPADMPAPVAVEPPPPEPLADEQSYPPPTRPDDQKLNWLLNNVWGARAAAQAAIDNNALSDTHEVQDNGKGRFRVVPKAEAPVAEPPALVAQTAPEAVAAPVEAPAPASVGPETPAPAAAPVPQTITRPDGQPFKNKNAARLAIKKSGQPEGAFEVREVEGGYVAAPVEAAASGGSAKNTPRKGKVDIELGSGEIVLTSSGRETTPFPKVRVGSNRSTSQTIKRVDQWLMDNAILEAASRGDNFNRRLFEASRDKPSQSDKDSAELYLFDPEFNYPVPMPVLKPIGAPAPVAVNETPVRDTQAPLPVTGEAQVQTHDVGDRVTFRLPYVNGKGEAGTRSMSGIVQRQEEGRFVVNGHDGGVYRLGSNELTNVGAVPGEKERIQRADAAYQQRKANKSAGEKTPPKPSANGADAEEVKGFYVTLKRDDGRTAWLAGPFASHEEAKAAVERAVKVANEIDPRTHFDAYGTASRTAKSWDALPKGRLNDKLTGPQQALPPAPLENATASAPASATPANGTSSAGQSSGEGGALPKPMLDQMASIEKDVGEKLDLPRKNQEAFLKSKGMTFEDLPNVPADQRDALTAEYDAWFKKNGQSLIDAEAKPFNDAGQSAFTAGEPRTLPEGMKKRGPEAKEWYRGYDEAKKAAKPARGDKKNVAAKAPSNSGEAKTGEAGATPVDAAAAPKGRRAPIDPVKQEAIAKQQKLIEEKQKNLDAAVAEKNKLLFSGRKPSRGVKASAEAAVKSAKKELTNAKKELDRIKGVKPKNVKGKPRSLIKFLQDDGGVRDEGGDLKSAGFTRFPGLITKSGWSMDKAREKAAEAGYLGDDIDKAMSETTINDLIDAIYDHPRYSVHDREAVFEMEGKAAERDFREKYDAALKEVDDAVKAAGANMLDGIQSMAAGIMLDTGMDVVDAIDLAVRRQIAQDLEEQAAFDAASEAANLPSVEWDEADLLERLNELPEGYDGPLYSDDGGANSGGIERASGNEPRGYAEGQAGASDGLDPVAQGAPKIAGEAEGTTYEVGADNKPQAVIPGTEKAKPKTLAEMKASAPLKATAPQQSAGGMFDEANTAPQLFDQPANAAPEAAESQQSATIQDAGEKIGGEGKAGPDTALYSVAEQRPAKPMTAAELRETLTSGPDGAAIAAMLDSGKVVIHDTAATTPGFSTQRGKIQGLVTPDGVIHIVAGNIDQTTARGVMLHEAFHAGAEALIGTPAWRMLLSRVENSNSPFFAEARKRAEAAKTSKKNMAEEIAAYAIENRENAPAGIREAIDNFIGKLKAWALKRFGKQFGDVTPGQLRALAVSALRAGALPGNTGRVAYSKGPMKGIIAYHGSPHSFDRFDISKIGTGEGAQAYGYGLYFAESEGVAKSYRDALAKSDGSMVKPDQQAIEAIKERWDDLVIQRRKIWEKTGGLSSPETEKIEAKLDELHNEAVRDTIVRNPSLTRGSMYQVRINADPEHFLDWDKPLSQQSPVVQQAADEMKAKSFLARRALEVSDATGKTVWEKSRNAFVTGAGVGDDAAASSMLRAAGIPGIKYLDQGSRAAGEGSYNYVVFDDSLIEIENKYSVGAPASATPAQPKGPLAQKFKNLLSDIMTQAMVGGGSKEGQISTLAAVPVRALFTELSDGMPAARNYIDFKQQMDQFRNEMNTEDDKLVKGWNKFARKNKAENESLMRLMHRSTLAEYDPSLTSQERRAKGMAAANGDLDRAWNALPSEAKQLYTEVRDAYAVRADAVEKQVVDNVAKAIEVSVEKAKRRHAERLEQIRDEGLTGKDKADAIKAADDELKMAETRGRRNKAARLKRMRAFFESNRMKGPYFPLARFGNYFVTLRDADGKVLSFEKFESRMEQRKRAEELRAKHGKDAVFENSAERKASDRAGMDAGYAAEIDAILDEAGVDIAVRDAIYQAYLETMPDLSMRKARIHRKGTPGFNEDAIRAYASNMFHSAHQLSRLRFNMDMQNSLEEAREQIKALNGQDAVRAQAVWNEMRMAHEFSMNPEGSSLSNYATSAVFFWTIAGNLSTAMVNVFQTVNVGVPVLAFDKDTKQVGIRAATRELAKATRDFVAGRGSAADSTTLSAEERDAMDEAYRLGIIDNTQAHDLAGVADKGAKYRPWLRSFMSALSEPMHQAERLNREVTFLAAYRIAKGAGLAQETAIKKAADQTWMAHFDNQSSSKPRFARGDTGKVLFALKSYQANFVFRVFRDLHQTFQGKTAAEREVAIKRLASMFALTGAVSGVSGLFFFNTVMMVAKAFLGLVDKDDEDPEEMLRKWVAETAGDTMYGRAVAGMVMDGIPGYLTGTSLTDRTGMGDMWFRSSDREGETFGDWIGNQIVPYGILKQWGQAKKEIEEGRAWRGLEKLAPAFIRNPMKAGRYAYEGVLDKDGNPIVEKRSIAENPWAVTVDFLKQATGFTPAEIADRYARNNAQYNMQKRIQDKATQARTGVSRALLAEDYAAADKAREKVDAFNARYPEAAINEKSIIQSLRNMERRRDRLEYGVDLSPKLSERIKGATAPSIYSR